MKTLSKLNKVVFAATLAFMVVSCSLGASAVPSKQVHIDKNEIVMHGACCQDVPGEKVQVTEPDAVVPVVLTWSVEYRSTGPYAFGIRLNGGGCGDYGPTFIPVVPDGKTPYWPITFQTRHLCQ